MAVVIALTASTIGCGDVSTPGTSGPSEAISAPAATQPPTPTPALGPQADAALAATLPSAVDGLALTPFIPAADHNEQGFEYTLATELGIADRDVTSAGVADGPTTTAKLVILARRFSGASAETVRRYLVTHLRSAGVINLETITIGGKRAVMHITTDSGNSYNYFVGSLQYEVETPDPTLGKDALASLP